MADSKHSAGHAASHSEHTGHHIASISSYRNVLIALVILTVLTVAVARPVSGFDAGLLNAAIAFLIASVKASLVLAIFMGLKYDKKLYLAIFLTAIFFVVVMFSFSVLDIYTRIYAHNTL